MLLSLVNTKDLEAPSQKPGTKSSHILYYTTRMLPAQHLICGTEGGSTLVAAAAQKCQLSPRSLGQGLASGGDGSLASRWKMFSPRLWGMGGYVTVGM